MKTIWFCGKDEKILTSIAECVGEELISRDCNVEVIVKSEIEDILGNGHIQNKEEFSAFADRLGFIGKLLNRNNIFALVVFCDIPLEDRKIVKENHKHYIQINLGDKDQQTDIVLDKNLDPKQNAKIIVDYLVNLKLIQERSQSVYSKEEEEEIRKRLEDLGYV